MDRNGFATFLAVCGIAMVLLALFDGLTGYVHRTALDVGVGAIIAVILLAMAVSR